MNRKCPPLWYFLFLLVFFSCKPATELKVLQINIWQEGTMVESGFDAITNEIVRLNADVVLFCEIRNHEGKEFIPRIIQALEAKGLHYYGQSSPLDVGIISKYPVAYPQPNLPKDGDVRAVLKAHIQVDGKTIALYSAHLDYTNYACYLPRGYSGTTWKKLDAPVLDVDSIMVANRKSLRDEAIQNMLEDAKLETAKGNMVIAGGDFNEPSHLDWQEDTKDLYDHNGVVINWDCSVLLVENGFKDAFREKYPNPVSHPGFTFPSDNTAVGIEKLAWAPDVDERDRIDFIYYVPNNHLQLHDVTIVGPSQTIIKGKRAENDHQDVFSVPTGTWPTDHKALFATFKIQ